jgi:hypothetical protein
MTYLRPIQFCYSQADLFWTVPLNTVKIPINDCYVREKIHVGIVLLHFKILLSVFLLKFSNLTYCMYVKYCILHTYN